MAVSTQRAVLPWEVQRVWSLVTSLENCGWRSDLEKIEILDKEHFVEYTKEGYATRFTITGTEPLKRWEFDMENDNMKGHWTGEFSGKEGKTEVIFTERVTAKKLWMRPFVKLYLKKQQSLYLADLKKGLSKGDCL